MVVDDDLASDSTDAGPGRRGTAATLLVEKVCGAAAQRGLPLAEIARLGRRVAATTRSMAVALRAPTLPGEQRPSFDLDDGYAELGIGIHGECGTARVPVTTARETTRLLVDPILAALSTLGDGADDGVIVVVNGLGGTHPLELSLMAAEVADLLDAAETRIRRTLIGTFVTAFDMAGVSVRPAAPDDALSCEQVLRWLQAFVDGVVADEPALTELDREAGDGDFGATQLAALRDLHDLAGHGYRSAASVLQLLSESYLARAGGISGAMFGMFFRAIARAATASDVDGLALSTLAAAVADGDALVRRLGGARPGDRTLVDALAPAAEALDRAVREGDGLASALGAAATAARLGAEATTSMIPRRGRASYLGDRALGVLDPGALVVARLFAAARDAQAAQPGGAAGWRDRELRATTT